MWCKLCGACCAETPRLLLPTRRVLLAPLRLYVNSACRYHCLFLACRVWYYCCTAIFERDSAILVGREMNVGSMVKYLAGVEFVSVCGVGE